MITFIKNTIDGKKEKDKSGGEHFAEITQAAIIGGPLAPFTAAGMKAVKEVKGFVEASKERKKKKK